MSNSKSHKSHHHYQPSATGKSNYEAEEGDPEIWASFNNSYKQVQSVLDRNRHLIQQVNENHQSRMHDNMVTNVSLIQELNGNINKVASMYSDLNSNFTDACQQHSRRDK